jgi:membrane protein YqaA with SNARE-associated domain
MKTHPYIESAKSLIEKTGELLRSRYGLWFLAFVAFADSALALPIITDPFMIAHILADRRKALIATVVTVSASVVGGLSAYFIASLFIDQLLTLLSPEGVDKFNEVVAIFNQGTFTLSFLGALAPIPYTFVALVAGALKGSVLMFFLGSVIGRSIRYGIVAYFVYTFGEHALELAKRHIAKASITAIVLGCVYLWYLWGLT